MSRPPLPRPTLIPGLRRTWRDPRTVQLGAHPTRAHLLDLPDPAAAAVLDLLDGTRPERVIARRAADLGIPPRDLHALLDALHEAGLLLPATSLWPAALDEDTRTRLSAEAAALALHPGSSPGPLPQQHGGAAGRSPASVLRRRRAARVVLSGRSRLAAGVAVALAEAGIGHVHADVPGTVTDHDRTASPLTDADLRRPTAEAVHAAVLRASPATETRPIRRGGATLVIQFEYDQPVAVLAAGHAQRAQPYLPVAVRDAVPIIGPLVPAHGGPCLNCLELHRQDRATEAAATTAPHLTDPGDPLTAVAPHAAGPVAAPPHPAGPPASVAPPHWAGTGLSEPCAVATLLVATGYVVGEALAFIDGQAPATLAAEVEIGAPGLFRRRSWTPHPACFCTPMRSSRGRPSVQGGRSPFSRSQ